MTSASMAELDPKRADNQQGMVDVKAAVEQKEGASGALRGAFARGPWCCGAAANVPARRRAAAGRSWYASARSSAAWYASPGHGDAARFSARFSAAAGRDDAAAWPTAGHAAYGRTTRLPAEARHAAASWDAPWLSASRPSARFPSAAAPAGAVNESSDSRSRAPHCLKKIGSLGARSAPRKTDDPSF